MTQQRFKRGHTYSISGTVGYSRNAIYIDKFSSTKDTFLAFRPLTAEQTEQQYFKRGSRCTIWGRLGYSREVIHFGKFQDGEGTIILFRLREESIKDSLQKRSLK